MRVSILLLAVLAAIAVAVNADCSSPRDKGKNCATIRYYHKKGKGKCVKFYYRGRGGNENNFKTKGDCEAACPADGNVCKLDKDSGRNCGGIHYFHDTTKGKCVNFKGRLGNKNKYKTKEECDAACTRAPPPTDPPATTASPTDPPATAAPELTYTASPGCSVSCNSALGVCTDRANCVVSCPDITNDCLTSGGGSVWGHDIYTSDSTLCKAAVNAGIIPATGGVLRVNDMLPALKMA